MNARLPSFLPLLDIDALEPKRIADGPSGIAPLDCTRWRMAWAAKLIPRMP